MKQISLWIDQAPRPADLPVTPQLPEQVDVAIIGSGYTGLNAARVLAQNGTAVAVLEQNHIGWGASSRNGGMATPGIKQDIKTIFKKYGPELGRQFWQASLDAIDLLQEIVESEQIDCDFRRNGHIALAFKSNHFTAMQKAAVWYKQQLNHDKIVVPLAEIRREIGSDGYFGGLADEYSAGLHPAKYVFGLARAVARQGVYLCENTAVARLEKTTTGYTLHTNQGPIKASEVLVATNGYTGQLLNGLKPHVFPVGSYIITTEPLPADLQTKLSPKGRMFYDSKWFLNYFRLTPDGRMLWGGRNNLSPDLDLQDSAQRLQKQMVRIFPELRDVPLSHTWTGRLGITFDLMPHIGRINGVHYAVGYGGHGLSIASYIGREMGLLLSGQKTDSPFLQIPQQTMFFYRQRPWFLPLAVLYYRTLDWLT